MVDTVLNALLDVTDVIGCVCSKVSEATPPGDDDEKFGSKVDFVLLSGLAKEGDPGIELVLVEVMSPATMEEVTPILEMEGFSVLGWRW